MSEFRVRRTLTSARQYIVAQNFSSQYGYPRKQQETTPGATGEAKLPFKSYFMLSCSCVVRIS